MIIVKYLILAAIVMGFSILLSNYVDIIDKRTSISGAFIGGVVLAAITSLPELFTSVSATLLLGQPELVIGNILGSDIFNTAVLALLFLAFPKRFHQAQDRLFPQPVADPGGSYLHLSDRGAVAGDRLYHL